MVLGRDVAHAAVLVVAGSAPASVNEHFAPHRGVAADRGGRPDAVGSGHGIAATANSGPGFLREAVLVRAGERGEEVRTTDARVPICTAIGEEMLAVHVDDGDPFVVLAVMGETICLTRDEARRAADALRAAASRNPFRSRPWVTARRRGRAPGLDRLRRRTGPLLPGARNRTSAPVFQSRIPPDEARPGPRLEQSGAPACTPVVRRRSTVRPSRHRPPHAPVDHQSRTPDRRRAGDRACGGVSTHRAGRRRGTPRRPLRPARLWRSGRGPHRPGAPGLHRGR
jgi:hypothetical protein